MSAPVVTDTPDADVYEAFELMGEWKVRRLPIIEDGQLIGIITENDLLRWVRDVANE